MRSTARWTSLSFSLSLALTRSLSLRSTATSDWFTQLSCTLATQIGFEFDPSEAAWDKSFEELRLVAAADGGVAHVSTSDPDRQALGEWCNTQARADPPPHDTLS